jgi:hypothetical protein
MATERKVSQLALIGFVAVSFALGASCSETSTSPTSATTTSGAFQVTGAAGTVDSPAFTGTCPHRFTFTGTITASQAGTASYRWERSDNTSGQTQTVTFSDPGSQTQVITWDVGTTTTGWQRLHILGPNELVGNQANFSLTCTTPNFAVTAASAAVDSNSFIGTCPHVFTFTGTITANAAGQVTYRWERSDGTNQATQALTFAAAGTQSATNTWGVATATSGWSRLHVLTPTDLTSNQATFTLGCNP